jgi:hemoglobin
MAGLVALGLSGGVWAGDDKPVRGDAPPAPKGGDQRLYDELRKVINQGADIYNGSQVKPGDPNGCYRFFQGALSVVRLQLDQYPDLVRAIDTGLTEAERLPSMEGRAFALRRILDNVRTAINPGAKKPETQEPPKSAATLWDRLGGEQNVKKVVDEFVAIAAADPKIDFTRGGKYKLDDKATAHLKKELVDFVSQATGGPFKYSGKDMREVHAGMGITDAQFEAAAADLKKALQTHGAKPEDIDRVLKAVGSTRNDIVEPKKPADKEPIEKKPEPKKPADKKTDDK